MGTHDDDRYCVIRLSDGKPTRVAAAEMQGIDRLRREPDALIWLNIRDPESGDIEFLEREFELHPLALEDLRKRSQRSKVDT